MKNLEILRNGTVLDGEDLKNVKILSMLHSAAMSEKEGYMVQVGDLWYFFDNTNDAIDTAFENDSTTTQILTLLRKVAPCKVYTYLSADGIVLTCRDYEVTDVKGRIKGTIIARNTRLFLVRNLKDGKPCTIDECFASSNMDVHIYSDARGSVKVRLFNLRGVNFAKPIIDLNMDYFSDDFSGEDAALAECTLNQKAWSWTFEQKHNGVQTICID